MGEFFRTPAGERGGHDLNTAAEIHLVEATSIFMTPARGLLMVALKAAALFTRVLLDTACNKTTTSTLESITQRESRLMAERPGSLVLPFAFLVGLSACTQEQKSPVAPEKDLPVARSAPHVPAADVAVELVGERRKYAAGEMISFSTQNLQDSDLFMYCSVDQRIAGEWRAVLLGINGKTLHQKSVELTILKGGEERVLSFSPSIAFERDVLLVRSNSPLRITCFASSDVAAVGAQNVGVSTDSFEVQP
jgi:hypothetical protein